MIYKVFNNNKLVSTEYTIPALSRYLTEHHPTIKGTSTRSLKRNTINNVWTKGGIRIEKMANTDHIKNRVIPKIIRNIRTERDLVRRTDLKWGKSIYLNQFNYVDIAKMIMEKIKLKGSNFLKNNRIGLTFESKIIDGERSIFGTKFLNFNRLYDRIITVFLDLLQRYEEVDINIMKIGIRYVASIPLNHVIIYKGTEKEEDEIMDDIINRMIIDNKDDLIKILNKFYIWSPSTNKNCCIDACFMAKHKKRDIKKHVEKFIEKYNKDKNLIYTLDTLCPLLMVYLKVNIKVICIDDVIEKYEYDYDKTANTINIMVKGGHTYALIPKKDFLDTYEKPDNKLDAQQLIKKPVFIDGLINYKIAVYDLETCNTEELKEKKNDTTVYALGYYNGDEYKEIYKTEKDKDKNVLLEFIKYLYNVDEGNKIIYAHNGGKFDTFLLLKEILKSDLFSITSFLDSNGRILNMTIQQNVKKNSKKYIFRDSINLIAGSLDGACKSFKPKTVKLEGDVNHDKININNCHTKKIYKYTSKYLKCDCYSLYEILDEFDKTITKAYGFGVKEVMTNASIARRTFLENHYDEVNTPLYTLPRDVDRELRKYYYGGRNECTDSLGYSKGKYYYVDFTSLYPFVMGKNEYFYGKMNKINFETPITKFNKDWFGFVKVMFRHKHKNNIPYHAVFMDNKLVFPYVDTWTESIISTEDIRYSLDNDIGYEYKFMEVFNWKQKTNYFKPIVEELYKMKINAQKKENNALRSISKIIINSLYGFFGINFLERNQTKIIQERCGKTKTAEDSRICRFYGYLIDQKLKDHKQVGKYDVYQLEDKIKSKCANVGIASMVCSYARTELYKLLKKIKDKGGKIIYMDTDSVISDYNIYKDKDFKDFIGLGGEKLGELTNECFDEVKGTIKGMYINKIIKEKGLKKNKDSDKIDELFDTLGYKDKIKKYMEQYNINYAKGYAKRNKNREALYFKERVTLGNKMYALKTDFIYEDVKYEVKIIKMKGVNSKQKYDTKEINDEDKTITYKSINRFEGNKKIDFEDYKYMCNGYKITCDNMNFVTGAKEMLIKDKGLIKINNTKTVKQLYDKANWDKETNILTPKTI